MATSFGDHILTGTHAARPAATAVPTGTLYSCSDHDLVYRSDGSAWSTWATVGGGGAGASPSFAVVQKTASATGLSGNTILSWDTEIADTDSYHDNSTNNSRLTVPTAGIYKVGAAIAFSSLDVGTGYQVRLAIDGTVVASLAQFNAENTAEVWPMASRIVSLTASQYVEIRIDTSDTNYGVVGTAGGSQFAIERLRDDT